MFGCTNFDALDKTGISPAFSEHFFAAVAHPEHEDKIQLIEDLKNESFNRVTYSFYKYITIHNLSKLRNKLYIEWKSLNILGRIYIAKEGINAQLSIPEHNIR